MDRYTKFLLTVIAISLLAIALKPTFPVESAFGAADTQRIEIVGISSAINHAIPIKVEGKIKCELQE